MITVTGQTFPYRDTLKSMGARWNNVIKAWQFDFLDAMQRARLQALVGVVLVDDRPVENPYHEPQAEPVYFHRSGVTQFIGDDPEYLGCFADQNPIVFFGFSSLAAVCDYVEALERPDNTGGTSDDGWQTTEKRIKFTGTADMQEALDLARHGWTEGFGLASKFDIQHAERKQRFYSMAGGSVNVGRMLAGNPKHMIRRQPQPKNKRITLFIETIAWRGFTTGNMMLRALLIASIIDLLETQGYQCNVYAVAASTAQQDFLPLTQWCVAIKDAGERLNLLDLTFALGHPSFLRRFQFAAEGCVIAIEPQVASVVSSAFTDDHQPGLNQYYFKKLSRIVDQSVYSDPMIMLEDILPDNLPIEIKVYDQ
jgi:hypothetical protein